MSDNLHLGNITPPKEVIQVFEGGILDKNRLNEAAKKLYHFLGRVDQLLIEKKVLQKKVEDLKEELGSVKTKKEIVEKQLEAANVKLDARPFLELTESEVIPNYIRNAKYLDPVEKWYISIRYEVTLGAKLISFRLNDDNDAIWKVAQLLVRMFRGLLSTVAYADNPNRVEFTNDEWKELFEYTNIKVATDQIKVKEALQPITDDQLNNISLTTHFIIFASGIGLDLENNSEFEETDSIKKKCPTNSKFMSKFYFPVNNQGKYKNEVVFQVDDEDDKTIDDLEQELRQNLNSDLQTSMKIKTMKIYSRKSFKGDHGRGKKRSGLQNFKQIKKSRNDFPRQRRHNQSLRPPRHYSTHRQYSPYGEDSGQYSSYGEDSGQYSSYGEDSRQHSRHSSYSNSRNSYYYHNF